MKRLVWMGCWLLLGAMVLSGCAGKGPLTRRARDSRTARGLSAIDEEAIPPELSARGKEFVETESLVPVFFDFDSYQIRDDAREALRKNASWLGRYPGVEIQIEGHCDERGTQKYNLALGQRRATSARNHLVSLGIDAQKISTISYGKERPFAPGHNEEAWQQNRRAHFLVRRR